MPDLYKDSITFHASPSIINLLNPLATSLRITHQAALASPQIELPRLICSVHDLIRYP